MTGDTDFSFALLGSVWQQSDSFTLDAGESRTVRIFLKTPAAVLLLDAQLEFNYGNSKATANTSVSVPIKVQVTK
jgi:hypothetical protein